MKNNGLKLIAISSLAFILAGCSSSPSSKGTATSVTPQTTVAKPSIGAVVVETQLQLSNISGVMESPKGDMLTGIKGGSLWQGDLQGNFRKKISSQNFPAEDYLLGVPQWAGEMVLYSSNEKKSMFSTLWNTKTGEEKTFPNIYRTSMDPEGKYLIGCNTNPKELFIYDIAGKTETHIPIEDLGFPEYCRISNLNFLSTDSVLYAADLYSGPGKYDKTEVGIISLSSKSKNVLYTFNEKIDTLALSGDKSFVVASTYPEDLLDVNQLPGHARILSLDKTNIDNLPGNSIFFGVLGDNKTLLGVTRSDKGAIVYCLYDKAANQSRIIQDFRGNSIGWGNRPYICNDTQFVLDAKDHMVYLVTLKPQENP